MAKRKARGVVIRATLGTISRRGKFRPAKRRARANIHAGFHDEDGVFHPIRSSSDYDRARAGEGAKRPRKAKPAKRAKAKRKAKPKRKAKARPAMSKAKRKKTKKGAKR